MNNGDVCEYVNKLDEETEYMADIFVEEGYGQTCGGYLSCINSKSSFIYQKQHFLDYYGRNDEIKNKLPRYQYLRCPQLLLFISEIVGVPKAKINDACEILKNYEDKEEIRNTKKSGNYIWGTQVFRDFKSILRINVVSKIIRENNNLADIKELIHNLFVENI